MRPVACSRSDRPSICGSGSIAASMLESTAARRRGRRAWMAAGCLSSAKASIVSRAWEREPVAVLVSGGLDSCILVGELSRTSPRVTPIYIRFGLVWEPIEERSLSRFLAALSAPNIDPVKIFEMPIRAVYGDHWSTTGQATPDAESADEAVYLPGRNLLLVVQAAIWCHLAGIRTLALGPLAGNSFPDATDGFFETWQAAINAALQGSLTLVRPYRRYSKLEVLRRGADMPLAQTLSCIHPIGDLHCGRCNKCAERQRGFAAAGMVDPTEYGNGEPGAEGRGPR